MNRMLEDRLGKLAMLVIFGQLASWKVIALAGILQDRDSLPHWPLLFASQLCALVFLGLILWLTATRLPPRDHAQGLMPQVIAVAGTFIMAVLVMLPSATIGETRRTVAAGLVILGTTLSVWCLWHLGRSFSIMASSRELRTSGSYGIVRHPLYAAELVATFGAALAHGSAQALGLAFVWLLLQIRRAQYEESVLRETFPEYADYARRVPMLIPGLHLRFLAGLKAGKTAGG